MNDKYDSLIILVNKSQVNDVYKIYDILSGKGKHPLILKNYGVEIENKKYSSRSAYYYQDISKVNYSKVVDDAYSLFHSLAEKEVSRGIKLRQFTNYKGVSLWDLSAQYMIPPFRSILYYLNLTDIILDLEKPEEVYVIDNKSNLAKIFYLVCRKKSIDFIINKKTDYSWMLWINKLLWRASVFLKKIKNIIICCYLSALNLKKSIGFKKTYKVIFFAPVERCFLHMIPVILKYNNDERLVINVFAGGSPNKMKKYKIFYMDLQGYDFFGLFDLRVNAILKRIKNLLSKDSKFISEINYKGLPIGLLIADIVEKACYEKFPQEIRRVDILRQIILRYKPRVIVISDSYFEFALIAKNLDIPIVGMQTGHPGEFSCYVPCVVDVITVEGNYWKQYMSKRDIDANRIHITGSAKLDFLHSDILLRQKNSNLLEGKDKSKKIVIFATIHAESGIEIINYERIMQTKAICNALKNIRNVHLIIKLHPFDNDFNIYKKIAKEAGLLSYSIIRDADILNLLYNCDLLITHHSKVSYEAVLMDKNVIVLSDSSNFLNNDVWNFQKYGVAMAVTDLSEIEAHIRRALFDPEISTRLRRNRRQYIFEHAYKIDGKASERIKEVIDRFI